jgi:hypothetical protein
MWCLLTAGHIIKGIEDRLASGDWKFQYSLVDDLGPSPIDHNAIPFDYEGAPRLFIDDDQQGLDFGLVFLRPYYCALLEKNSVVPITEKHWKNQGNFECDRYLMLGFPTEFIETDIRETADGYHLTGALSPMMGLVTKLESPPLGVTPTTYQQFIGRAAGSHDMDGMSGCPIFGVEAGRDDRYWIVAIQNSWFPSSRVILGTPVPVLAELIERKLDKMDQSEKQSSTSNP